MRRKSILNMTSTKKRDKMIPAEGGETPVIGGTNILASDDISMIMWIPTARSLEKTDGAIGTKSDRATRNSQTCYMVGLKEKITLRTSDATPWLWRRICFTYKGDRFLDIRDPGLSDLFRQSSAGWMRLLNRMPADTATNFLETAFQGTFNVDWSDRFTAALDTSRISVKYDKVTQIKSQNDTGIIRTTSRWHSMRKNIVYGDEERGDTEDGDILSSEGRAGMGDYYIVDMFRPLGGESAVLGFTPEAQLYWHEK